MPGLKAQALVNAGPQRGHAGRRTSVQAQAFFKNIFKADPAEATRKKYQDLVDAINALESTFKGFTDDQLRAKTEEFKQRAQKGESLESLLPEAFAVRGLPRILHAWTCRDGGGIKEYAVHWPAGRRTRSLRMA